MDFSKFDAKNKNLTLHFNPVFRNNAIKKHDINGEMKKNSN